MRHTALSLALRTADTLQGQGSSEGPCKRVSLKKFSRKDSRTPFTAHTPCPGASSPHQPTTPRKPQVLQAKVTMHEIGAGLTRNDRHTPPVQKTWHDEGCQAVSVAHHRTIKAQDHRTAHRTTRTGVSTAMQSAHSRCGAYRGSIRTSRTLSIFGTGTHGLRGPGLRPPHSTTYVSAALGGAHFSVWPFLHGQSGHRGHRGLCLASSCYTEPTQVRSWPGCGLTARAAQHPVCFRTNLMGV